MGNARAQLGHLVDLIDALTSQIVKAVEVGIIVRNHHRVLLSAHTDHRLKYGALTVLNPLAHRVEVGGVVDSGWKQCLVALALALAIQLLPPLGQVMQTGAEIHQYLNLLASAIQRVARLRIQSCSIIRSLLHLNSASHQCLDVVSGNGHRQQSYGGEHTVAATHVVGNHKRLVALLVGQVAQSSAARVGDGHNQFCSLSLAHLALKQVFEQTEGNSGLGGGARLGDYHNAKAAASKQFHEVVHIVLAYIVAGKQHTCASVAAVGRETAAQGLNHGLCAQITAAYAYCHHIVAMMAHMGRHGLNLIELDGRYRAGQVQPAQKAAALASAFFKFFHCAGSLGGQCIYVVFADGGFGGLDIDIYSCCHSIFVF